MQRVSRGISAFATAGMITAGLVSGACRDEKRASTAVEVQTPSPAQATNLPATVSGCLRAGDAESTFVLTAAEADGARETATYQLVGRAPVNLKEYVGRRIEVTGVVRSAQEVASRPAGEQPTGTSGGAKVETRTVVDIKTLDVDAVKPLAADCPK